LLERLEREERIRCETVWQRKNGERIDVSLTISAIRNASGKTVGASTIARDITDRKRLEAERERLLAAEREARREAEAANRTKDEFLAVVSHELRTPLTSILGWARQLRRGKVEPRAAESALEIIERNARVQAQRIDDILDVSRIITGNLRLEFQPVAVATVIALAIDVVRPAADRKSIELVTRTQGDLVVSADPNRLQQIVWNLLSNAVKFTPSGGRVEVWLERAGPNARITVRDTGKGISAEFLAFVFDRFSQADSSTTRVHAGLGLGLAIVRHLVELHGGLISAQSEGEGRGATFSVELPLSTAQEVRESSVGQGQSATYSLRRLTDPETIEGPPPHSVH
jgi:signal transduction histidine kinase